MVGVINRVTQLSKTVLEADVMSLVINTNVASLNAQRSLAASGGELKTAMERLSSGKQINSAADDAAGFAIAERMTIAPLSPAFDVLARRSPTPAR